jgi:hypothetical protein
MRPSAARNGTSPRAPGRHPGRERILFVREVDNHHGRLHAWRVSAHPPSNLQRPAYAESHRVALPGYHDREQQAAQRSGRAE